MFVFVLVVPWLRLPATVIGMRLRGVYAATYAIYLPSSIAMFCISISVGLCSLSGLSKDGCVRGPLSPSLSLSVPVRLCICVLVSISLSLGTYVSVPLSLPLSVSVSRFVLDSSCLSVSVLCVRLCCPSLCYMGECVPLSGV